MSKEVHNGPTDETQARGTPYSGDPQGGAGLEQPALDKLPLDEWHRGQGGRMVSLELISGQRQWELNIAGISTPWVAGEWVYVVTDDAKLIAAARSNGATLRA